MLDESVFEEATALAEARQHVAETDAYQSALRAKYQRLHFWYAPPTGDQWPWDAANRPGKLHYTGNILKPAVDIGARLEAKLPRITLPPASLEEAERARAEVAEKSMMTWLEASGWESWMHRMTRTKRLYGKAVLRPFWNKKDKRPDVTLIENPADLRLGWGASDFTVLDWALYEYSLSPQEIMRRWKDIDVLPTKGRDPLIVQRVGGDHSDPLGQKQNPSVVRLGPSYNPSEYEKKQVKVWDYWYKRDEDVYNCIILQETLHAVPPTKHREMVDIPYIPVLNDFEPGSPEGISAIEHLTDLQEELNRATTHWQQLVADEIDPAWQLTGKNAEVIPGGMIPKSGQIVPTGEDNRIEPISKPVNQFPIEGLVRELKDQYHMISGLGEIAFGTPGSSQESGQALAVQMDAYNNRGEPSRILMYDALKDLLIFWTIMVERLNPKIDTVDADGNPAKAPLGPIFKNFRRWKLVAPEITPKDVQSHTMNEINKLNAGVQSIRTTMDALGIDSPEDELATIGEENSNIGLNPGKVQQQIAVAAAMQQMGIQQQQLEQQAALQGSGAALAAAQDQTGANNVAAQQQQVPSNLGTEDNQGTVPPAKTSALTLVRSNAQGEGQTLNQIAINRPLS